MTNELSQSETKKYGEHRTHYALFGFVKQDGVSNLIVKMWHAAEKLQYPQNENPLFF